ncbi:MAG TPA: hypothetical protein VIL36_14400 [Acidimicrobiales bacterium]
MPENKSVPQVLSELWGLTKDYARQETVEPLKGIGRYLAYGFAGVVVGSIGVIMLLLAMLRALQTETGSTFTGSWSWAPYALVLLAAGVLGAIAASRIGKRN